MQAQIAAIAVATTTAVLAASLPALAALADIHVRIEGRTTTLFDRVVRTEGHAVVAASDSAPRRCDGTNAGRSDTPGPTAATAAVDALRTIGQDFDGQWYPGFDDYFVTRLGGDAEDDAQLWWWGVLVDREFAPVGGCQLQVEAGNEVLWVYDAFSSRPFLWLDGAATATVGQPFEVSVTHTFTSTAGGTPSAEPYAGADVTGVTPAGSPVAPGAVVAGVSDADGGATVTFDQPGWQRLKARDQQPGQHPAAIASNSIDVCVEQTDGDGCAGPPPSQEAVVPDWSEPPPGPDPPARGEPPPATGGGPQPSSGVPTTGAPGKPRPTRRKQVKRRPARCAKSKRAKRGKRSAKRPRTCRIAKQRQRRHEQQAKGNRR